jgi:hypothetical protein
MSQDALHGLKARLRQRLSIASPEQRPEILVRWSLLLGLSLNASADEMAGIVMELQKELGISDESIQDAMKHSELPSEIWPTERLS